MAPATAADDAPAMSSNAASATLPTGGLATGHAGRDLKAALELRDPRGVLSVYIHDAGPRGSKLHDRTGPLRDLVAASRSDGIADLVALEERIAALDGRRRTHSRAPGLAVFAGVASGRTIEVPLPVAVESFAAFDDLAHVRGLLEALGRARPAGVVVASAARLAVLELRGRTLVELEAVDLAAADRIWRRRRGRRAAPSAPSRQPGPSPDRHARRRDQRLATAATNLGARVGTMAVVREWDLVVATGNSRLLAAFTRRFPAWRTPLIEVTAPLRVDDRSVLAAATAAEIAGIRARWANDLIADLVEDPGIVWGSHPVAAALERGRIQRIAIAADVDAEIAERLIRLAIASGAELTLADAGALGPPGVAARPRW
jgi:hypothetical protein